MDVSIIIVNYNTKELLNNCLTSIYEKTSGISFEVIVSDNGSKDGSVQMIKNNFPQVLLVENKANLGFGTANNRGRLAAKGKYVFFLNSDTLLLNNAVKIFFDYFESHNDDGKLAALGCNLLGPDGNICHSFSTFHNFNSIFNDQLHALFGVTKLYLKNKIFKKTIPLYKKSSRDYEKFLGPVDYITGADLFLLNNEDAEFDEKIFMYCEESELQYRLFKKGLQRKIIDGPEIIHLEGASSKAKEELNLISVLGTFSSLNDTLNRIYVLKKHGLSPFRVFLLKTLTFLIWKNPMLKEKSGPYIPRLLKL